MAASCGSIVGLVCLVLANLCLLISFAAPYWLVTNSLRQGLWAYCTDDSCVWVYEEAPYYLPERHSKWWLTTQGAMILAVGLGLLALLLATATLCCVCKCCNTSLSIAVILFLTFLVVAVAVMVFGFSANETLNAGVDTLPYRFSWAMWMAVTGGVLSLFGGFVYCMDSRKRPHY